MLLKLELSSQMLAVIAAALGNHPFREAAPVINEIQRQISLQQQTSAMNGKVEEECLRQ